MSQNSQIENKAKTITLVPLRDIKLNPKNRNTHSEEQIVRLAKIIKFQGFREPGIISNLSGLLVAGEGRYLASKKLGLEDMPCIFQDFENEEQEYLYGVSTNAVASWAELDLSSINADLADVGPFDIDLLGIKDFVVEPADFNEPTPKGEPKEKDFESIRCPNCGCVIENG
jgi:hypothetical protein